MKKTVLSLRSPDHEALSDAVSKIFKQADRTARVSIAKVAHNGESRVHGVDISFDVFDKELIEALQKIDFTENVKASFRDVV